MINKNKLAFQNFINDYSRDLLWYQKKHIGKEYFNKSS